MSRVWVVLTPAAAAERSLSRVAEMARPGRAARRLAATKAAPATSASATT